MITTHTGPRNSRRRTPLGRWMKMTTLALMATATVAATITGPPIASAEPDNSPTMAAHGVEAALGAVPWSQVGPGWMLAMWSPVPGLSAGEQAPPGTPTYQTATTTLYLVDPAGGRYAITTFPPPGDGSNPRLVDWSGDGTRALFATDGDTQDRHHPGRPAQRHEDHVHRRRHRRHTPLHAPRRQGGTADLVVVWGVARTSRPCRQPPADVPGGTRLSRLSLHAGRHAAGAGDGLRPRPHGQRRGGRQGAADRRPEGLRTDAVVGRGLDDRRHPLQ